MTNEYTKISYIKKNNSWLEIAEKTEKPKAFYGFKRKTEKAKLCICDKCNMIKSANGICGC
jgi:hypothetical protein